MTQQSDQCTIRLFESSDLDDIMLIERQSFRHPWSANMFEALFLINPGGFYVVSLEEHIAGFAIVLFERDFLHTEKPGEAHLMNIAIGPSYRRMGLGTALLNAMSPAIKKAQIKSIRIEVRAFNYGAITFYSKLGFRTIATVTGFYGNEDAVIMMKDIV